MKTHSIFVSALSALVGSLIANIALLLIFAPFTGMVNFPPLSVSGVTIFTVAGVLGAAIVYAIVLRFSTNPTRLFTWISAVVLVLSFLPDIFFRQLAAGGENTTSSAIVLLMAFHVACAVITVWALTRLTAPRVPAIPRIS